MNPLINPAGRFKEELRAMINTYGIDNRIGLPDFILAEYMISTLSTIQEMMRERTRYFDQEVKTATTAVVPPKRLLIFADTRAMATEWAYQNGVVDWVYVVGLKSVLASFANRPIKEHDAHTMGQTWKENLQALEALNYAVKQIDG
jgi:hypothetical protein